MKEEDFKNHPAIGKKCFICNEIFTLEAIEKSKKRSKLNIPNSPVRMENIPGWVHRRCRGELTVNLIENSFNHEDMSNINI